MRVLTKRLLKDPSAWFLLVLLLGACGAAKPPTPLYPDQGRTLSANEVATLHGDVREVDGNVVSEHGGSFALLPGCHLVRVVESWGRMDPNGGVVVKVPPIAYAMPMRAGYRYIVRIQADLGAGGGVKLSATEEDAEGNVTNNFAPASPQAAAECRSAS